jgi:hypothetical protein
VPSSRVKFYKNRQIINIELVDSSEYEERIILCIPHFAWRVARAYLSEQAQWESTYAAEYFDNGYITPDQETLDQIFSSIDEALSVDDMSCDLTAAIAELGQAIIGQLGDDNNDLIAAIADLAAKTGSCGSCGSGGAGSTEAPPVDFEDNGENYPESFTDRTEYDEFKCKVAGLIIDYLLTDLRWFQNTDATAIVAAVLVTTLLTPVPGDEIVAMVGGIAVMVAEGILDTVLDNIITQLEDDKDDLVCQLYYAIDTSTASAVLKNWAESVLDWAENHFLGWLINDDAMNWLFSRPNLLLPDRDCSECFPPCEDGRFTPTIYGSISQDEETCEYTLESIVYAPWQRHTIELQADSGYEVSFIDPSLTGYSDVAWSDDNQQNWHALPLPTTPWENFIITCNTTPQTTEAFTLSFGVSANEL